MNRINLKKGFTLIELLVVIAIIGILSAVVLASLNTARDKASDASIKADLNNIRAQAELFYDASGLTYANACGALTGGTTNTNNTPIVNAITAANAANGTDAAKVVACASTATAWAAAADLKSGVGYYCVDSTGNAKTYTTALDAATGYAALPLATGFTVCP